MTFFEQISNVFGGNSSGGQAPGGAPQQAPSPVSSFFDTLLTGAERGASQAFAGSSVGTNLSGFLAQGQSQLAAQNLFGNPLILIAVVGLVIFAALKWAR